MHGHKQIVCKTYFCVLTITAICSSFFIRSALGVTQLGGEAIWRENEDQIKGAIIIADPYMTFNQPSGIVVGWNVYISRGRRSQIVQLQIWRQIDLMEYEKVGETNITAMWVGHSYFLLYPQDRFEIQEGDVIGFYFPGYNPIPWTNVPCNQNNHNNHNSHNNHNHYLIYNHPNKYHFDTYVATFQHDLYNFSQCRVYSLNVTVMNEQENKELNEDYVLNRDGRYNRRPYGPHMQTNKRFNGRNKASSRDVLFLDLMPILAFCSLSINLLRLSLFGFS